MIRKYLTTLTVVAFLGTMGVASAATNTSSSSTNAPSVTAPAKSSTIKKVKHSHKHGKVKKATQSQAKVSLK